MVNLSVFVKRGYMKLPIFRKVACTVMFNIAGLL